MPQLQPDITLGYEVAVCPPGQRRFTTYTYSSEDAAKVCATLYRNSGYRVACYWPQVRPS